MPHHERRLRDVELVDDEPADERRPVRARRHFRRPVLIAALVGAAVVAVAAIGLARIANDQGSPISVLDRAQRSSDVLPDSGSGDFIATSARQLASDGNATFWVVLNREHLYCLVTTISGPAGGAGSTCGNSATLERGLVLGLNIGQVSVTAALVADGADAPSAPPSWERISENVFLGSY